MFKPTGKRILVELVRPPEVSAGGLHVPLTSDTNSAKFKVVAVGTNPPVAVGDVVLVENGKGQFFEYQGRRMLFVPNEAVTAIVS